MSLQTSISKISVRPDLSTHLLQILIPTTFNSLLSQKRQFTLQLWKYLFITPKKSKWKFIIEILPVQKEGFQETACPCLHMSYLLLDPILRLLLVAKKASGSCGDVLHQTDVCCTERSLGHPYFSISKPLVSVRARLGVCFFSLCVLSQTSVG